MIALSAVSQIAERAAELRTLNYKVEDLENQLDDIAMILEGARERRRQLIEQIETLMLQEAVQYPTVVFDEHRPHEPDEVKVF